MAAAPPPIVVFDGVCNFCSAAVDFILAHERDHEIRFAAAQSQAGRELLLRCGRDPDALTSLVFLEEGKVYVRSDAALALARHLRLPWRWLGLFRLLPRRLRDPLYELVARHRYRWFGRRESCRLPTPALRWRFLEP